MINPIVIVEAGKSSIYLYCLPFSTTELIGRKLNLFTLHGSKMSNLLVNLNKHTLPYIFSKLPVTNVIYKITQ